MGLILLAPPSQLRGTGSIYSGSVYAAELLVTANYTAYQPMPVDQSNITNAMSGEMQLRDYKQV